MMQDAATRLHDALEAAGIPINGVALTNPVRIDFKPEATQAHRDQAATIVANFDWRRRRKRSYAAIMTQINNLTLLDRNKLLAAVAADFLREHPKFAAQFGISIEGDEPEP